MQDELATIDVSPLDALGRIKAELDTLEQRLAAMEERKESVAAAVYMRVRTDYESRRRALEDEAAPLQTVARQQYAQLRDLLARSEADHETTRLDREEIEFRFSLGEFDDTEHKKRIKAVDKQLADKSAARAQAEAMKQRFVSVFRSEQELELPVPATPGATRKLNPLTEAQLGAYDTNPGAAAAVPPPMQTSVMQVPPVAPGASPGATQMMRAIRPGDLPGAPPAAPAARGDSTMIMRTARLVPQNPEAGKQNYTLALKPTVIGSDDGSDVRLPGAARRHAEIRVSMAGFTLSDEGGGVRVNNVAVTQHLLRHEDSIEFGPARFVFRGRLMTFAYSQERHGGVLVVAPSGRLDNESAVDFELAAQELLNAGERHIVVDLAQLNYISNAGLRVLGKLGKALKTPDTSLRLCGLTAAVRQVFDAAGAATLFEIRPDLKNAVGDHPAARGAADLGREALRLLGGSAAAAVPVALANAKTLAQLAVDLLAGGAPAPRAARAMAAGTQVVKSVRPADIAAAQAAKDGKRSWFQKIFGLGK